MCVSNLLSQEGQTLVEWLRVKKCSCPQSKYKICHIFPCDVMVGPFLKEREKDMLIPTSVWFAWFPVQHNPGLSYSGPRSLKRVISASPSSDWLPVIDKIVWAAGGRGDDKKNLWNWAFRIFSERCITFSFHWAEAERQDYCCPVRNNTISKTNFLEGDKNFIPTTLNSCNLLPVIGGFQTDAAAAGEEITWLRHQPGSVQAGLRAWSSGSRVSRSPCWR